MVIKGYTFFYKQFNFYISLGLLREDLNFRLKVTKKLLTIYCVSIMLDRKTDGLSWSVRVVSALVFTSRHILLVLFYPINLMVAYPLNQKMPQLLATFEN